MGVIVFHIGMPKAGSTSLQLWLGRQRSALRERGIECVRVAQRSREQPIRVEPTTETLVASKFVVTEAEAPWADQAADDVRRVCEALDSQAQRHDFLLLTSESYEVLFSTAGRRALLPHFDALARSHDLRIAYYVRPQHTWLESAWLQWGFRLPVAPSRWVLQKGKRLDYFRTVQVVRECAPNIEFEVRPFRADLLDGGTIVADFARRFLGLTDASLAHADYHANPALPLELALLLRGAPRDMFWSSMSDNRRLYALKDLVLEWDLPPSETLERSRRLLHAHARQRYEPGNQKLIAELGWPTEFFVPPLDDATASETFELRELDTLWASTASPVERRIARRALQEVLARSSAPSPQDSAPNSDEPDSDEHDSEPEQPRARATRAIVPSAKRVLRAAARRARANVRAARARAFGERPAPPATSHARPPSAQPSARRPWHPRVVDVAPDVGLGLSTRTFGAVVFDANGDGWPDIFLCRHDAPAFLFRNDHGRFVRDTSTVFPGVDRHCGAAGDLTGDGRLDLFCVIGGASGHEPKRAGNELWLQQPDGTFVNEGAQPGLADPYGRGREAVLFDATGNGRLDILVGNVSPRSDGKPSPNRLFLNEGNGRFRPAPELGLDLEYSVGGAGRPGSPHGGGNWPMGRLATLDAAGRGWTDVVMCAVRPGDDAQRLHLFHNDEGRGFHDVTADVGLAGIEARDAAVADLTGDGRPDLVVIDRARLRILLNDHGRFRVAYEMPVDDAFRLAVADASGDGRPDIYVMRTKGVPADDVPDLLLLRRSAYDDYETVTLPTVDGTVRDDQVYAIDYDRDGRSEFLVLHGHSPHAAPIQLIALR